MTSKRRMGPPSSASRDAIFDAVEHILRQEGHAGLSARRVAEEAGFNHQTIYYYFQTMEELVLSAFRRRSERSLGRLEAALASDQPFHAIWSLYSDQTNGRLHIEFNALAMRNWKPSARRRNRTARNAIVHQHSAALRRGRP